MFGFASRLPFIVSSVPSYHSLCYITLLPTKYGHTNTFLLKSSLHSASWAFWLFYSGHPFHFRLQTETRNSSSGVRCPFSPT